VYALLKALRPRLKINTVTQAGGGSSHDGGRSKRQDKGGACKGGGEDFRVKMEHGLKKRHRNHCPVWGTGGSATIKLKNNVKIEICVFWYISASRRNRSIIRLMTAGEAGGRHS